MSNFQGEDSKIIAIRPLNKGIIKNVSENSLPVGGLLDAQNCVVDEKGIRKRRGFTYFPNSSSVVAYPPIMGLATFWKPDGTQISVVWDSKFIYRILPTSFLAVYDTYAIGTCSSSGTTVTGVGSLWVTAASDVQAGDIFVLDADGSGDGPEEIEISSITNDTELELVSTPVGTFGVGSDYEIRRAFKVKNNKQIDFVTLTDKIVFTDGTRTLRSYDGTTFGEFSSDIVEIGDCLAYHRDRLWMGRITSSSIVYRTRMIWTSTVDLGDFTPSASDLSIDRPYQVGEIIALKPLGDFLAVYYSDRIDLFRPTNVSGNFLPLAPVKLETGNVGLVGLKAVTSYLDGHFFIGQDDIYYLGVSKGLIPMQSPVRDDLYTNRDELWNAWAITDPINEVIRFGIPNVSGLTYKIWNYNYKSKAWSYSIFSTNFLSFTNIIQDITWDEAVGTWDTNTYGSWDDTKLDSGGGTVYVSKSNNLLRLSSSDLLDYSTDDVAFVVETGDMDFEIIDTDKTFVRLSLKLSKVPVASFPSFVVYGSVDEGTTYKTLGTLIVPSSRSEGYIDFRITGSTCRFKITNSINAASFVIVEIGLKVILRGQEVRGAVSS